MDFTRPRCPQSSRAPKATLRETLAPGKASRKGSRANLLRPNRRYVGPELHLGTVGVDNHRFFLVMLQTARPQILDVPHEALDLRGPDVQGLCPRAGLEFHAVPPRVKRKGCLVRCEVHEGLSRVAVQSAAERDMDEVVFPDDWRPKSQKHPLRVP